ncbi:DNA mismatch repair protein MutS [Natronorarus salvus]|uniref:DNA mismatch repair protein MutS n=1 Tax=Natronorarus salvus TaxID=3117733 RepID=UPI002F265650
MDSALGPPAKMAERRDELTPMLRQYFELCTDYDDCLVLFQVGDFYETFCEAAETVSRILEITLTKREDSTGSYPMAGIPIQSAESYIETLLDAGYRVAVADQVEDPEAAAGLVDRAVTRIVTPGTLTEETLLDGDDNNFVASVSGTDTEYGLALLDVSTGDFYATTARSLAALRDELGRFSPAEAIVGPGVDRQLFDADCVESTFDERAFASDAAAEVVKTYFGDPDSLLATDAEVSACGALLAYAEYTRGGHEESEDEGRRLEYLTRLTRYDPREYMLLDATALRSLELFEPRAVGANPEATLIGVLDETSCALGRRRLTDWLRRPLLDAGRIERRLDAVEELVGDVRTREALSDRLRDVYDVERLIGRVSRRRANARDLRSLLDTLDVVPDLRSLLAGAESEILSGLYAALDELEDVRGLIREAITETPPIEVTEGGLIREGHSMELDSLRRTEREGKAWIDELEATERERTGIDSLSVGFNSVHGYYIQVTNPNLDSVPGNYERRQTLKNAERFVTPELKEREEEIVAAEGRADDLEYELFCEVREAVADEAERVQAVADAVARLDALCSLATVAATNDYSRPEIGSSGSDIEIRGGRHPVVERTQRSFVPNDTRLDDRSRLAVITGPNMSGKSTYMRQVALVTVLSQVGSFVPARSARIGITDRVFTRVGASDDIAGGRSTFMVEMSELAAILGEATERSLILLDEVGRGTSTADGLAIARALAEFVHDEIGARTLFATHHHELTALADDLTRASNLHFAATQGEDGIQLDHEIRPGAATASYGIEVARAAGVLEPVIERASELMEDEREPEEAVEPETSPAVTTEAVLAAELRQLDLATMTPIEALTHLDELKRLI